MTRTPEDHDSRAKTLWLTILGLALFWGGAALAVALVLTACAGATPEPKIVNNTVTLPGELRSCIPADFPRARPVYPDRDDVLRTLAGPPDRYQFVVAGRALRIARLEQLETAVAGCR